MLGFSVWSLLRASGIVAYILLSLSVAVGLYTQVKKKNGETIGLWNFFHISVGNWALYVTLFHGILTGYDAFMPFKWSELLVPFTAHYQPIAMGLGTIGLYALVITVFTSEFRQRIGLKFWRKLHVLNPLLYIIATVHGVITGSDTRSLWGIYMYICSLVIVITLLVLRFRPMRSSSTTR